MPCASVRMWCLLPGRRRSVGFGPVFFPRPRRESRSCRQWHARNLTGRLHATSPAAFGAVDPIRARRCHYFSRRQHVMPEPHPISLGNISQGMPDFNTNRIPVSTRRLHSGFRPVFRLRRCFFGNSGSISPHKLVVDQRLRHRYPSGLCDAAPYRCCYEKYKTHFVRRSKQPQTRMQHSTQK